VEEEVRDLLVAALLRQLLHVVTEIVQLAVLRVDQAERALEDVYPLEALIHTLSGLHYNSKIPCPPFNLLHTAV
jgi:hypothetical protein